MSDLLASLYEYIYLVLLILFSFPIINSYKQKDGQIEYNYPSNTTLEVIVVLLLILAIGLRPQSKLFVDMRAYVGWYNHNLGDYWEFSWDTDNKVFDNLLLFWASARLGIANFFVLIAAIYFGCSYIGIKRLFPTHTIPVYLVFLAAFSTFSYATNGIKAGAAASIFIMALSYMDKKWFSLILVLISLGFHHSMQLPVAAVILTMLYKNPKWYFYGWFLCLIMSMLHITYFQELFGGMTDEQGAGYLMITEDTTAGGIRFRPDFILYSAIPAWIGYQFEMKRKLTNKIYSTLLHFYLCTNGVWMLCMYASFNNRIAYLSWFVYPIVLVYPFLYVDDRPIRYRIFSKAMKYHLYFTLFMAFVYYGILGLGH